MPKKQTAPSKEALRKRLARENRTKEKADLDRLKEKERQQIRRGNLSEEQKDKERQEACDRMKKLRDNEDTDDENERLEKQKKRQNKLRDGCSDKKKKLNREKNNAYQKKRRQRDKPKERPLSENEKEYLNSDRWERLQPVESAGSYILYLFDTIRKNLNNLTDWIWLYNTKTNEKIMASEFETLAKKYAVIFKDLGIEKGDVVHFFLNVRDHAHIHPALAGLWIIGAVGTFGNLHKWTDTLEKYQEEWAKGRREKYKSELQLQQRQLRPLNYGFAKIVICSQETATNAHLAIKDALEYFEDKFKNLGWTDFDTQESLQLVSLGPVEEGIKDISAAVCYVNENDANPVQMMHIDDDQSHRDPCVLLWDKEHFRELTTANLFFAVKEQWKKHRDYDVYTTWDFQYHGCSFLPKSVVKEQVFLPFAALENGRPCCFEGDPMDDIESIKKSFFDIKENNPPDSKITKNKPLEKSCIEKGSPILPSKPYSFKKSKITFTMEDLENDMDEDENIQIDAIPSTSRAQPKRRCRTQEKLVPHQSDTSEDEAIVKDTMDHDEEVAEDKEDSDSKSDSDWYAYPDSNMHGDSDDNEETRKLNRCFGNHYDESCYFHDPNDL